MNVPHCARSAALPELPTTIRGPTQTQNTENELETDFSPAPPWTALPTPPSVVRAHAQTTHAVHVLSVSPPQPLPDKPPAAIAQISPAHSRPSLSRECCYPPHRSPRRQLPGIEPLPVHLMSCGGQFAVVAQTMFVSTPSSPDAVARPLGNVPWFNQEYVARRALPGVTCQTRPCMPSPAPAGHAPSRWCPPP